MTEAQKNKVRKGVWKYCGAMFMEDKNGEQAVSITRVFASVLFLFCLSGWGLEALDASAFAVPDMAVYTLWSLLGVKASKDVASNFGRNRS